MTDQANSAAAEAGSPHSAVRPANRPQSVTQCGLQLTDVRLRMVVCTPGDADAPLPAVAEIEIDGSLAEDSLTEKGFRAIVTWSTRFADRAPLSISGKHELTYAVEKIIAEEDAKYYAEVNTIVLIYPYVRQLISDLSAKCLGRAIMLRTLDVPKVVRERTARRSLEARPESDVGE